MTLRARTDWYATAHGRNVWILDPERSEIHIDDIALSLSRQTRFAGHYKIECHFYSVAQHSVLVSEAVAPELALAALLHDASEAYLQDIIKPLKNELGDAYSKLESLWAARINIAFGLSPVADQHPDIKRADLAALMAEKRDLLVTAPFDWTLPVEPLQQRVYPWDSRTANAIFLKRFHALYREPFPIFSPEAGEVT